MLSSSSPGVRVSSSTCLFGFAAFKSNVLRLDVSAADRPALLVVGALGKELEELIEVLQQQQLLLHNSALADAVLDGQYS